MRDGYEIRRRKKKKKRIERERYIYIRGREEKSGPREWWLGAFAIEDGK